MILSIKNVPDDLAALLRERAARNHRSLQGELLAIVEEAVRSSEPTVEALVSRVEQLGLRTEDSAPWLRDERDHR